MTFEALVLNIPDYAENYEFIVARLCNGDLWFFGAYETLEKAKEVVSQFDNALVVYNR